MSIKDNVNEISENNVTIAEAQQKVYEAGVRAGLAQDPDYAEGYDDGYEQGLTDSSGVVWEDLLSGKVPVGKAREADHTLEADHAINADRATSATRANEADYATNAEKAINAHHSTNADHSTEADHSLEADHSSEADHATKADNATFAEGASHASTASVATMANSTKAFDGVLPIENGGTGCNTIEQLFENLGIKTYQKPWNTKSNIGTIVAISECEIDLDNNNWVDEVTTGDSPIPDEYYGNKNGTWKIGRLTICEFPAINSGDIGVRCGYRMDTGSFHKGGYIAMNVYANDVLIKSVKIFDASENWKGFVKSGEVIAPVTVSKGDNIRVELELRYWYYTDCECPSARYYFNDDNLRTNSGSIRSMDVVANIETPYKYISILNATEPSVDEIFNTLLEV